MIKARSANEEDWQKKTEKYVNEGMSEKAANKKAEEKMKQKDRQVFKQNYGRIITHVLQLQNGSIHRKIMDYVKRMLTNGNNKQKSIRMAINKYGYLFDALFDQDDEESDDEDSDTKNVTDDED